MCILLKFQEIDQNLLTYKCSSYTLPADVSGILLTQFHC